MVPGRFALPDQRLPGFLAARVLPLTHGLALMRDGLLGDRTGLANIWGMGSATMMAALSLAVVTIFAAAVLVLSIRVFTRSALR